VLRIKCGAKIPPERKAAKRCGAFSLTEKYEKDDFIYFGLVVDSMTTMIKPLILITLIFAFSSCLKVDKWRCDTYKEYLNHENFGRLEEKYIDKGNHARETLILKHFSLQKSDIQLTLVVDGLYDTIQVGDELLKEKGSNLTIIKRGTKRIELTVDKSKWCEEN
jgi:hypothetical protein